MKRMDTIDREGSRIFSECHWLSMSKNSVRKLAAAIVIAMCLSSVSFAQSGAPQPQQAPPADQKQDQNIPDAPSAVQPPKPAPEPEAPAAQEAAPQAQAPAAPGANEPAPRAASPESSPNPAEKPPINIQTVPEGRATKDNQAAREQLFTLTTRVDQVVVPVTVKDDSGRL